MVNLMGNLVVVLGTIVFVLLIGWWVTTFFVIVRQKRVKVIELLGKFYNATKSQDNYLTI